MKRVMLGILVAMIMMGVNGHMWRVNAAEEGETVGKEMSNCDSTSGWSAVRVQNWGVDRVNKKEGDGSLYFVTNGVGTYARLSFSLRGPGDWSDYKGITFWVRVSQVGEEKLSLLVYSVRNKAGKVPWYASIDSLMPANPYQWKKMSVFFRNMRVGNNPDLSRVTGIEFRVVPNKKAGVKVWVDNIRLITSKEEAGRNPFDVNDQIADIERQPISMKRATKENGADKQKLLSELSKINKKGDKAILLIEPYFTMFWDLRLLPINLDKFLARDGWGIVSVKANRLPYDLSDILSRVQLLVISPGVFAGAFNREQMSQIVSYVRNGGSLLMIGGRETFGGGWSSPYLKTRDLKSYQGSPLEVILPVKIQSSPDFIDAEVRQIWVDNPDHPVTAGIDWDMFPPVQGYNRVVAKKDAVVLLKNGMEGDPLLVVGKADRGRVMALMLEFGMRGGVSLQEWPQAKQFWQQAVDWLANISPGRIVTNLNTDKQRYTTGEVVRYQGKIIALPEQGGGERGKGEVEVKIIAANGRVLASQREYFPGLQGTRERIRGTITLPRDTPSGIYRLSLSLQKDRVERKAVKFFKVVPQQGILSLHTQRDVFMRGENWIPAISFEPKEKLYNLSLSVKLMDSSGNTVYRAEKTYDAVKGKVVWRPEIKLVALRYGNYRFNYLASTGSIFIDRKTFPIQIVKNWWEYPVFARGMYVSPWRNRKAIEIAYDDFLRHSVNYFSDQALSRQVGTQYFVLNESLRRGLIPVATLQASSSERFRDELSRYPEQRIRLPGGKIFRAPMGMFSFWSPVFRSLLAQYVPGWVKQYEGFPSFKIVSIDDEASVIDDTSPPALEKYREVFNESPPKVEGAGFNVTFPPSTPEEKRLHWQYFKAYTRQQYNSLVASLIKKTLPRMRVTTTHASDARSQVAAYGNYLGMNPRDLDIIWQHVYPIGTRDWALDPGFTVKWGGEHSFAAYLTFNRRKKSWIMPQTHYGLRQVKNGKVSLGGILPPEFVEKEFWQALTSEVQGIWFFAYNVPQHGWVMPGTDTWERLGQLFKILKEVGPLLITTERPRGKIAVLYAFTTDALNKDTWGQMRKQSVFYKRLVEKHLPVDLIYEEDIVKNKALENYKLLFLPGVIAVRKEVRDEIQRFLQEGGVVYQGVELQDKFTKAHTVNFASIDGVELDKIAQTLQIKKIIDSPSKELMVGIEKGNGVDVLILSNQDVRRARTFSFSANSLRYPFAYDLVEHRFVGNGQNGRLQLTMKASQGTILGFYPEKVYKTVVSVPERVEAGEKVNIRIEVKGFSNRVIDSSFPLEVVVKTPAGKRSLYSGYLVTSRGSIDYRVNLAKNDPKGKWTVMVRNLATGETVEQVFKVKYNS